MPCLAFRPCEQSQSGGRQAITVARKSEVGNETIRKMHLTIEMLRNTMPQLGFARDFVG
jgi:hypothetical protein